MLDFDFNANIDRKNNSTSVNEFYCIPVLPKRIKNTLLRNEFEYINELSFVSPKELLQMKGMGKKGLSDLIKILDDLDIQLSN